MVGGAAAVTDSPKLMKIELVGLRAAAAAELLDRGKADREVVALEREGSRNAEPRRLLDEPALVDRRSRRDRRGGRAEPSLRTRTIR